MLHIYKTYVQDKDNYLYEHMDCLILKAFFKSSHFPTVCRTQLKFKRKMDLRLKKCLCSILHSACYRLFKITVLSFYP